MLRRRDRIIWVAGLLCGVGMLAVAASMLAQNQRMPSAAVPSTTNAPPGVSSPSSRLTQAPEVTASATAHLAAFPRPPQDNGWGVHWTPALFAQEPDVVDYFGAETQALGIKWVKLMNGDSDTLDQAYLVHSLVARGIMPVLRVYKPFNDPYEHLDALVRASVPLGVHYFELYNEPNTNGSAGGWRDGEPISVPRMLDLWIPAADGIAGAGGFPGLPSLAPGGDYDDLAFLRAFLDGVAARGRQDLLQRAWLPLHNYFLNHPVDYPNDDVNLYGMPLSSAEIAQRRLTADQAAAINHARAIAHLPRAAGGYYVADTIDSDSNGFRKFEAYAHIFSARFGYPIPIISTEGGAVAGADDDPRYPPVRDSDVSMATLYAYRYMIESAPDYYFAFMPWLLANAAGGNSDSRFEGAAWYKDRQGLTLPVVSALKRNSLIGQVRRHAP